MSVSRHALAEAALVAVGLFAVYAAGACRTIYVGDSGELVAAAATLGIPHPSGYPLYVLFGKLWTLALPVGSVAFRMSLFSAFCAALASGLLHFTVRRQGLGTTAGLFAALVLAFGPSFWSQANVQRVYALNALALVASTAAVLEWVRSRRTAHLALAAFLAGLGASNHTFMAVFGLAAGVFAVTVEPGILKRPRRLLVVVAAGLAGLLPYAYLPLRSRQDPRLDWGNPETLQAFLDVVSRRDFWDRAWIETPGDLLTVLGDYLASLAAESLVVGALLALVGLIVARRRGALLPLLVMGGNFLAVALHGSRSDIFIWHRYYIPSYVMLALLAAWGVEAVASRLGRKLAAVTLVVPVVLLFAGYRDFDRSDYRTAEDFSRQLLASLPPGAHLAASDDNVLFVLIYLHLVEEVRPDVDLILQGVGSAELAALRFDPDDDPLYFTHHPNWDSPGLEVVPVGLVFKVVRAGSRPDPVWPEGGLAGEDERGDYLTQNLVGHFQYMLGLTLEERDWRAAEARFERAAEAAPENDVLFYNLGLIYRRNGLYRRALAAFERSHAINPRGIASNKPVRAADRIVETRRELERVEALVEGFLAADEGLRRAPEAERLGRLADLLAARGEAVASRGYRLRTPMVHYSFIW